MAILDSSSQADGEGVKVHVIRSGEHKGVGLAGVEITDSHIKALQKNVNSLAEILICKIAGGRCVSSSKIRQLATGEMWVGKEAKQNGLVDAVEDRVLDARKAGDAKPLRQ